ncbi:MAG: exodeoxyribonuclease VII large subunit [Lachnospiraceae bacterium]|nr:exodeoxyribonuclease VII large subunit [Lachnospiraceae bacterium]
MSKDYSVSDIFEMVSDMFRNNPFLRGIKVSGEISQFNVWNGLHIYLGIKDAQSELKATAFNFREKGIDPRQFKMGDKVVLYGDLSVNKKGSQITLNVLRIEKAGISEFYQKFLQMKQKLEAEGLFDASKKKALPKYAKNFGIVTAKDGAALQDILRNAKDRNPYVKPYLYPAKVQGEGAALSIAKGIKALDALGLDFIIVGRGGGSPEELWAFNEEIVARAIAEAKTPIISAVGHEVDFSISDFVADVRAATPTHAAVIGIYEYSFLEAEIGNRQLELSALMKKKLTDSKNRVEKRKIALSAVSPVNVLKHKKEILNNYRERLGYRIQGKIKKAYDCDEMLKKDLQQCMKQKLQKKHHILDVLITRMAEANPVKKLKSGYARISKGDDKVVSINQVEKDDKLILDLLDGSIETLVIGKEEKTYG